MYYYYTRIFVPCEYACNMYFKSNQLLQTGKMTGIKEPKSVYSGPPNTPIIGSLKVSFY